MAQLERATSRGGKKYYSSGIVKYDEVEAKTIRVGGKNNASGVLEVLDATNTLKVSLNKDGVTLSNGAELINDKGVFTNLQFTSGLDRLGYWQISLGGVGLVQGALIIDAIIPSSITIEEAYITLTAFKTTNEFILPETGPATTSILGKITNIRAYKLATSREFVNNTEFGTFETAIPTGTEISNTFATGGYTNPTTNGVVVTSIDIASQLATGYNGILIKNANSLPDGNTDAGTTTAANETQYAEATLTIIGYAK